MNFVRLIPVILSSLVLSAHFSRGGGFVLSVICMFLPLLLVIPQGWVARLMEVFLLLGSLEWLRRTWELFQVRQAAGEPWLRMAIILVVIALLTAASALVFRKAPLRERYGLPPLAETDRN